MKHFFALATSLITSLVSSDAFADNILGAPDSKLKNGNITFNDIPVMINHATNYVLGLAGTIAMIMIIYGAFQMSLIAITSDDKKKGADTIKHGIIGFVIAASAWLIVKVVISNL